MAANWQSIGVFKYCHGFSFWCSLFLLLFLTSVAGDHCRFYLDMSVYHVVFGPWQNQLRSVFIWAILITAYFLIHPIFKVRQCCFLFCAIIDISWLDLGEVTSHLGTSSWHSVYHPLLCVQCCGTHCCNITDIGIQFRYCTCIISFNRTGTIFNKYSALWIEHIPYMVYTLIISTINST